MISVEQQAAEVIAEHTTQPGYADPGVRVERAHSAARALAEAGLLAPELSAPGAVDEFGNASWFAGPEAGLGYVDIGEYAVLPPNEARYLARQILAAARYAEEGK